MTFILFVYAVCCCAAVALLLLLLFLLLVFVLLLLLLLLLCPTQFASALLGKLFATTTATTTSGTINEQSRAKQVGAIFNTCQEAETTHTLTQSRVCCAPSLTHFHSLSLTPTLLLSLRMFSACCPLSGSSCSCCRRCCWFYWTFCQSSASLAANWV